MHILYAIKFRVKLNRFNFSQSVIVVRYIINCLCIGDGRSLVERLYSLPEELVASRLTKLLTSRFVILDPYACQYLLPHFLTPCSGLLYTDFVVVNKLDV